ncbi:complexin-4-like [Strix aluco]|uniref:complexin-4-like n=1 Tax=Strix aluco TaxID=111821 RepID=UPI003DA49290
MAFLMKSMLSNQVKNLGLGGGGEENKEESTPSDPAAAAGMTREEYEEYQKQMVEEKIERDAAFAQKKAERACLRVHLREKYRLPQARVKQLWIHCGKMESWCGCRDCSLRRCRPGQWAPQHKQSPQPPAKSRRREELGLVAGPGMAQGSSRKAKHGPSWETSHQARLSRGPAWHRHSCDPKGGLA